MDDAKVAILRPDPTIELLCRLSDVDTCLAICRLSRGERGVEAIPARKDAPQLLEGTGEVDIQLPNGLVLKWRPS